MQTHLLFTTADVPALREKWKEGWYREAAQELLFRAELLMQSDSPALDLIASGHGSGTSARQLEHKTTTLAMAGVITGREEYFRRGVQVFLNTIRQFHIDDFVRFNGHLCAGDAGRAESLALDLLCEYMTEEEIAYARNEIEQIGAWLHDFPSAWGRPHRGVLSCNHNTVHFGGLGLCALVLGGHEQWLARAENQVREYFRWATDATGFLTEGLPYGCYGLLGAVPFCEAYHLDRGVDLVAEQPKNRHIPDQLFAQTLPTADKVLSFNDNADRIPNLGSMMYLITKYQNGPALWWLQHITGKDGDGNYGGTPRGSMGSGASLPLVLLFSDPSLRPVPPEEACLPLTQRFESGRVFARDSWTDPGASLFFFTCGWDRHRGHNHCDQNSFAFFALGEEFLIDPPTIPTETECHNAVIINGEGQASASHGEIIALEDRGDSVFIAGDATESYDWSKNIVGYARRNALFVKGASPYLVLFDDIQTENDRENTYRFMVHTGLDNRLEAAWRQLIITGSRTGATCRVYFAGPQAVTTGISDLTGREAFRYCANHRYKDIFQQGYAETKGLSPRFLTVVTAARAGEAHPLVTAEDGVLTIAFPDGRTDRILYDDYALALQAGNNMVK